MIRVLIFITGILFLFSGYGCTPAGVIASGGATTMVVAEGDKSLGTVVDDATIKLNITTKFLDSDDNLFLNIDTKVDDDLRLTNHINRNRAQWLLDNIDEFFY